jgi:hypothetical protein
MGFALAHAEQSPLHDLERIGLQVDQDQQQSILGGRQRAVLVGGEPLYPLLPLCFYTINKLLQYFNIYLLIHLFIMLSFIKHYEMDHSRLGGR